MTTRDQFRKPPQGPPLFNATPSSILSDTQEIIKRARDEQNRVVRDVPRDAATFANVLLPLAQAENVKNINRCVLGFYADVSTDSEVRNASRESRRLFHEFYRETACRENLFLLVDAVVKRGEALDPESERLLTSRHNDFVQNGLCLPAGPKRERIQEIRRLMNQLSSDFESNFDHASPGVWFVPEELESLPQDILSSLQKGNGENEGKVCLTFSSRYFYRALASAKREETRQRYFIARENMIPQNGSIFKEMVILRDESARILGYPNHAALRLGERAAKTPETVNDFLADLRSRLKESARSEVEALKQLKREDFESQGKVFDGRFYLWDEGFYTSKMIRKMGIGIDHSEVAEYFPVQSTIQGMLHIFEALFGLVFVEIKGKGEDEMSDFGRRGDLVWHPDVKLFSVWNDETEGGGFVGYIYFDPFHRQENPIALHGNCPLQPGFEYSDGSRHYPATALLCGFPSPDSERPSLLEHHQAVTLFHELGHGIHYLVSKTKFWNFHGTNLSIDFGEGPSQMLEKWCWMAPTLKSISSHYSHLSAEGFKTWQENATGKTQPSKQIPDLLIEALLRYQGINKTLFLLSSLRLGLFDMLVHQPESHRAIKDMNLSAEYNKLLQELTGMDGPEALGQDYDWGHGHALFSHVISSDYDAGYYGYLFSQSIFDDIFDASFKRDPMNVTEGRRYRYSVLEKGGSQDEMKTIFEFLGREYSMEPFYRELNSL